MRNQEVTAEDIRFLADKNPPLSTAQIRELRTANDRIEAAAATGDCDGVAEAHDRINELLKEASASLADAARDAGDFVGSATLGAWAFGGVPEEEKGQIVALLLQ